MKKRYFVSPHQNKERAYVAALAEAGYHASPHPRLWLAFALYDLDVRHRVPTLEDLRRRGVPVFIYPHSARPMVQWDGMHPVWPHSRAAFVIAEGHREVMERFGYPIPMEVTGWTFCPILPFQAVEKPERILFGPIHPSVSGWMAEVDIGLNRNTFERLQAYCKETGARLTVRHVKKLELCGLKRVPGVDYVMGLPDLSTREIDRADVVVGHQTFAYLAIARGKPTLMMGEYIPPRTVVNGQCAYVSSWEKYADLLTFPLDILLGDAANMIARACRPEAAVEAWRERFIGRPFEPRVFVERLESYL